MNATLENPEIDTDTLAAVDIDRSVGDFSYPENHTYDAGTGLSEATIDYICNVKSDPDWVRDFRKLLAQPDEFVRAGKPYNCPFARRASVAGRYRCVKTRVGGLEIGEHERGSRRTGHAGPIPLPLDGRRG